MRPPTGSAVGSGYIDDAKDRPGNGMNWAVTHSGFCLVLLLIFFAIPLLFVFLFNAFPMMVLAIVGGFALMSLAPLWMSRGSVLAAGILAGIMVMAAAGLHCYYAYAMPLRFLREGRSYKNVYAQEPTESYEDAAAMYFAGDVKVDESQAIGMTSLDGGAHIYCVAPVLDSQSNGRVSFWAAGIDCCGRSGSFTCGDAGDAGATGGFVIADASHSLRYLSESKYLIPPELRRDVFLRAIAQAEARTSLVSNTRPILLHWSKSSRADLVGSARANLAGNLCLLAFIAACLAAVTTAVAAAAGNLIPTNDQINRDANCALALGVPRYTSAEVANFVTRFAPGTSRSNRDLSLFGFLIPLLVSIVSVILWSWMPCWKYGDFLSVVGAGICVATAATLALTPRKREYGVVVLLAAYLGCYVGHWNYTTNMSHYCAVANGRAYSNVPADAPSAQYRDAGKVEFDDSARIGEQHSVGFRHRGTDYCAAPIIGSNGSSAGLRVDFWAVGRDCCDARGRFRCAGAAGPKGSALVVHRTGLGDETYRTYLRAVQAAADLNTYSVAASPMLVLWREDLEALRTAWLTKAVNTSALASFIFFVVLAAFAAGSGWYARSVKRQEEEEWRQLSR
eukprot:TRINITY_DN45924_c0_g1_i1.p1 TRINITY_DN45924_c0_g1~~TRINITY_DN45924_c0_g1_i1.p1  ORF type:complete len:621 (+),score=86.35 TRINITY_DN45924_c0_g1_i1:106-1968(+)